MSKLPLELMYGAVALLNSSEKYFDAVFAVGLKEQTCRKGHKSSDSSIADQILLGLTHSRINFPDKRN